MASAKAGDAEEQRSRREELGEGPWPILVGVWASGRQWKRQAGPRIGIWR